MPRNPIGTASNIDGIASEKKVQAILAAQGWAAQTRYTLRGGEGGNLYGMGALISAFVHPCQKFPQGLAVDITSQNSPGTAYQKVAFKVYSAAKTWKVPCILVIDGNGACMPEARRWARAWHRTNRQRYPHFIGVLTFTEFRAWCETEGASGAQIYIPKAPVVIQAAIPGVG